MLTILLASYFGYGQEIFSFQYQQEEMAEVETESNIKKHFLGDIIAYKMQLLRESYTYIEPPSATSPAEKIIVEKQPIFFSIKKLDKFLKKQVKSGTMSEEDAKNKLENALNVALNIRYQETDTFEDVLRKAKPNDLIAIYSDRVKLEI